MWDRTQWLLDRLGRWVRRAAAAVLTAPGRSIPRHVAFIMDGNRRYAEARQLRKVEGHTYGYARLIDALEWCLELGVCCISVYAFSIDNYRRSGEEVDTLMRLAEEKLAHMLQEHDVLVRHGVQVRVIGDLTLAPPAVQAAAARVMEATAQHDRAVLNLCFSYTASEELQRALNGLAAQGASGRTSSLGDRSVSGSSSSLALQALEGQLYTAGCPPVDLLVRTSGETRLSDFLLWQCRHALLIFTHVLWPDFGFFDLVSAVLQYQQHAGHLQHLHCAAEAQAATVPGAGHVATAAGAATRATAIQASMAALQGLQPVKLVGSGQQGSPCSIASPASPSSPSSRSEDAVLWEDYSSMAVATAMLPIASEPAADPVSTRIRPAAAAMAARQQQLAFL